VADVGMVMLPLSTGLQQAYGERVQQSKGPGHRHLLDVFDVHPAGEAKRVSDKQAVSCYYT
jgi:hypothetical protein